MRTYPQFGQRSQRKHQMPDPASTSAGSAALLKMFGIHISAGALAAALGFLVPVSYTHLTLPTILRV